MCPLLRKSMIRLVRICCYSTNSYQFDAKEYADFTVSHPACSDALHFGHSVKCTGPR